VPIEESPLTLSLIPDVQFEVGQSLVIPKRHVALLTDLTAVECAAIMDASQRLMRAMEAAFSPLGVFVFQNNGVYSGQVNHMHVVPRQRDSDWGVGPPHMRRFPEAGRAPDLPPFRETPEDTARIEKARVPVEARREAARRIRAHLS
jgi:diadenosine tetraphosphate (Ap4A) HIT family hydrolase